MCDERETSATRRARAGGVRELRPKLSLCAGALVLGAAACLPAFRNAVSPTLPLLPYILGKIGVAGLAGLLYFLILGLSPAHCRLGGSVRAQSPASPKDTTALFADIDADIRDHGQRFGDLSIGREWVLFLDAMRISRIQGIFTAAIPPEREGESGTYSLWLADVDNNLLEAFLPSRKTLEDARAHLLERVPDAFIGGEDDLEFFFAMDGADRREINRRVRARQAAQAAPGPVAFAYTGPDGIPTSLATEAGIEAEFAAHPDGAADLVPLSPLFLPTGEECFSIACEPDGKGRFRFMLFLGAGTTTGAPSGAWNAPRPEPCFWTASGAAFPRPPTAGRKRHGSGIFPRNGKACLWTRNASTTTRSKTWRPPSTAWMRASTAPFS